MNSQVELPTESQPLNGTLKAVFAFGRVLNALHLMPPADQVHAKMSLKRRQAIKSAGWMVPKATVAIETTSAHTGTGIPLRRYLPPVGTARRTAILYVHGGGFAVGGLDSPDWLCRELAARGYPVVSVDYRLAPEHPYPLPLDDVAEALAWLDAHRAEIGVDRITVAGDSAGGNLVAALCLRTAALGGPDIAHQVLLYPALDATLSSPSLSAPAVGLTRADVVASFAHYATAADPTDPLVSPLLAPDLSGLPATTILTGEHDVLRDDGLLFAQRLAASGVPVFFRQYPGLPHAFFSLPKVCGPQAMRALEDLLQRLSDVESTES